MVRLVGSFLPKEMDPLCRSPRVTGVPKYARALSLALGQVGPRGSTPLPVYHSFNTFPSHPLRRDQENRQYLVTSSFWSWLSLSHLDGSCP